MAHRSIWVWTRYGSAFLSFHGTSLSLQTFFVPISPILAHPSYLKNRIGTNPPKNPSKKTACPANSLSPHMASPNPNQLTNPNQDRSRLHVDLDPRGGRLWIQAADSHLLGDWEGPTSHGGSLGEKSSFHGTCGNFPGLHGNFVKLHGHEMELDGIT